MDQQTNGSVNLVLECPRFNCTHQVVIKWWFESYEMVDADLSVCLVCKQQQIDDIREHEIYRD